MQTIDTSIAPANDNADPFLPNTTLEEFHEFIEAARDASIEAMDHDPDFLRELEAWSTRDDCISPDRPL